MHWSAPTTPPHAPGSKAKTCGLGGRPIDLIRTTEGLVRAVHYLDAARGRI